jgi:hypothetical protein
MKYQIRIYANQAQNIERYYDSLILSTYEVDQLEQRHLPGEKYPYFVNLVVSGNSFPLNIGNIENGQLFAWPLEPAKTGNPGRIELVETHPAISEDGPTSRLDLSFDRSILEARPQKS